MRLTLCLMVLLPLVSTAQIKLEDGQAKFEEDRIIIEANDAGEIVSVPRGSLEMESHHTQGYFKFKRSFQTVAEVITDRIEREFDVFIFANVSYERNGSPSDYIRSQNMKVFRKAYPGQQVFRRNRHGQINPSDPVLGNVLGHDSHKPAFPGLPGLMKVSSGASQNGSGYVDTFSGVFRVNHKKSLARRFGDGMFDSLYIDIVYPSGRESGIAIHGTFKSRYAKLGKQASHGCIRVTQDVSETLYESILSEQMYEPNLVDFDRMDRLPMIPLRNPRAGYKALLVFFYGYDGNSGLTTLSDGQGPNLLFAE